MENEEILDDVSFKSEAEKKIHLEPAAVWKRFLNFFIDYIIVYTIDSIFILTINNPDFTSKVNEKISVFLLVYSFIGVFFGYYWVGEYLFGGRTIGKLITGTKVVNYAGGSQPLGRNIVFRTLCRVVPFEPLSLLITEDHWMWHDRWSGTLVVDIKKSTLPDD